MHFVYIRAISLAMSSNNTQPSENMGIHFLRRKKKIACSRHLLLMLLTSL